jgi:hypothetical protein
MAGVVYCIVVGEAKCLFITFRALELTNLPHIGANVVRQGEQQHDYLN